MELFPVAVAEDPNAVALSAAAVTPAVEDAPIATDPALPKVLEVRPIVTEEAAADDAPMATAPVPAPATLNVPAVPL